MSDSDENDWINDEDGEEETMVVNPTSVRERIDNSLQTLAEIKTKKNPSQSRQDVMMELSKDLQEYYGYIPDLVELFLALFSPSECVEFMDASDRPRPLVIRANTLKTTRKDLMDALSKRGANVEIVDWSKVAIKITESSVPIGATPEYLAGLYMLQAAASLNPVLALDPQPGERVLDMSSAPGGKTSYIAQLMKNTGTVIANDLKAQRQKATVANLHRMGVKNAVVCCYDGRKIPQVFKGFDRVLLDAPCSGLGIISRDQSVKLMRTLKDVQRNGHLQKELICAAIDAVDCNSKTGGVVVYSTCSVSNEENEQVVQYALRKRYVRLVETGLEVGRPGFTRFKERRFHPSMALTRRFYPHVHNMDGFYVAKFVKYANGPRVADEINEDEENEEENELNGGYESEEEVLEVLAPTPKVQPVSKSVDVKRKNTNDGSNDSSSVQKKVSPTLVPIAVEKKRKAVNMTDEVNREEGTKQPAESNSNNSVKSISNKQIHEEAKAEKQEKQKGTFAHFGQGDSKAEVENGNDDVVPLKKRKAKGIKALREIMSKKSK